VDTLIRRSSAIISTHII